MPEPLLFPSGSKRGHRAGKKRENTGQDHTKAVRRTWQKKESRGCKTEFHKIIRVGGSGFKGTSILQDPLELISLSPRNGRE